VHPEITILTVEASSEENARRILEYLARHGFVREVELRG
jgi:hypothetical protein